LYFKNFFFFFFLTFKLLLDEEENEIIRRIEQEIVETKEITKPQKFEPSSLVIALSNFTAYEYDQLDIQKDEFLVVTNWNYKDGWVYGHRKDKINEEGSFPKVFAKICNTDNNGILIYNNLLKIKIKIKIKKIRKFYI